MARELHRRMRGEPRRGASLRRRIRHGGVAHHEAPHLVAHLGGQAAFHLLSVEQRLRGAGERQSREDSLFGLGFGTAGRQKVRGRTRGGLWQLLRVQEER